jgi:hypothetical protein
MLSGSILRRSRSLTHHGALNVLLVMGIIITVNTQILLKTEFLKTSS